MDRILLHNMKFYGFHGVSEHEREMGQRFEVDVELTLELAKAGESDELADTLDYTAAYEAIRAVVENAKFRLLEALAVSVAAAVREGQRGGGDGAGAQA